MEQWKIELRNLPTFISYVVLKKYVEKITKITPHRIKIIKKHPVYAYLSFKNNEEQDTAMGLLDGQVWKSKKLKAKKAQPLQDPYLAKHSMDLDVLDEHSGKKLKANEFGGEPLNDEQLGDKINDKVCPLWKTSYEEQLKIKEDKYREFASELCSEIKKLSVCSDKDEKRSCKVDPIKPSPVINGYRNKCEFSIGPGKVVGFRLGLYKEGSITVVHPPPNCPIVSEKMHKVIALFEEFLQSNELSDFNNVLKKGYWRQITVRNTFSSENGLMAIVALNPQDLSKEQLDDLKSRMREYFQQKQSEIRVSSLYLDIYKTKEKTAHSQGTLELISGSDHIEEIMQNGNLKLKISPFAFFQTNTLGAEVCYETITSLASLTADSVVLDICCGTGAIGLYLARSVKHVVGIELNCDAVKDARHNAEINDIKNAKFYEGKAESLVDVVIQEIIRDFGKDCEIVAIIDPPRAGLNSSVIKCLRNTSSIKKLIYVSCEPNIAKNNLIDLCRPRSNSFKGSPFFPSLAVPIDMFPHTSHCELILLYLRADDGSNHPTSSS